MNKKELLLVPIGLLDKRKIARLEGNGYMVIETNEPEKVKLIVGEVSHSDAIFKAALETINASNYESTQSAFAKRATREILNSFPK